MKKFITFVAFLGFAVTVGAQSTETSPAKESAARIEKTSCTKGDAKTGKSCCAGKADAKAEAATTTDASAAMPEGKGAACCAGKAGAAKSCHGDGAKAEAAATDAAAAEAATPAAEGKPAGCCAGKASAAKSCSGDAAKAHAHDATKTSDGQENK
jgi:hypothetical protein